MKAVTEPSSESEPRKGFAGAPVGPLDGTKSESITANMGIMAYDLWIPIPKLLEQIRVNEMMATR